VTNEAVYTTLQMVKEDIVNYNSEKKTNEMDCPYTTRKFVSMNNVRG